MVDSGGGFSKGTFTKLGRQKEVINFSEWLDQYQLAENSVQLYGKIVALFLKRREYNQRTVNLFLKNHPRDAYKSALKYYFGFKGWNYDLPKLKVPKKKSRDVPDRDTLYSIMGKLNKLKEKNEQIFWVILLLFNTGARIHEVLKLRVGDVKFKENKIVFRTKGDKFREVELHEDLIKGIDEFFVKKKGLLAGEKLFFRHSKNTHIAYVTFRKFIYKSDLVDKEKRLILRTHNFRRAVFNFILEKTGNIVAVKEFGGHGDIRTTMTYVSELERKRQAEIGNKALIEDINGK